MELTEFLQEFNVDFKRPGESPHVTSGWLGVVCPYCGEGTGKYGMGLHLERFCASCWKCGSHKLTQVLADVTGQSWHKVKLAFKSIDIQRSVKPQIKGKLKLPKGLQPLLPIHRSYLEERKFDPDTLINLWGLQSIGLASRLAFRIFIPIVHQGQMVSWTTRSISDKGNRYVTAKPDEEAVKSKSLLLGEDLVRHAIIIVEGPFDAFRIGPGAVSTLGTGFSRAQVRRASKYPVRVVVYDNDKKAQQQAGKLADELSVFPGKTYRVEIDAKDPGEASPKEIQLLRKAFL